MKAILDPYIFWLPTSPDERAKKELLNSIDFVISAVRAGLSVSVTPAVWQRINQEFLRFASKHISSSELATRILTLKKTLSFTVAPPAAGETWGMKSQFSFTNVSDPQFWLSELANVAVYWINQNEEFVFMTRPLLGRNVKEWRSAACVILEKTHWQIFVSPVVGNAVNVAIPCITSLRNLTVPWTQRYDDRLPDTAPATGLKFVPIANWRTAPVGAVIRAIQSKPTWVDSQGNGWSDTNTPGQPHHWDVFLKTEALKKKYGGQHVNIKSFGTKDREREVGDVHH